MPHVSFRTFSSFSLFNFALADHLAESLSSHWSLQQKLSLLPFCIQNACNKQNAFTCAQLSTLMQRNKPPGCRDSSTTGCQYGRMPCPCLHSLSSTPNPLRAIYSIISFSYSYFPAGAPPLLLLLLLLLLQLCGALRSLFICNLVFFEFVFLILNFAVSAVSPGQVYAS